MSFFKAIQVQIHDSHPLQCDNSVSEIFAHPPDLTVQALRQDNTEAVFSCFYNLAGTCYRIKDQHAAAHPSDKLLCHRPVHSHLIFLLMVIPGLHDTVHQASLIGKEEKALRVLVKTAYRIYPYRVIQILCYSHLLPLLLRTAYNASRFVEQKENLFFLYGYGLSVNADLILRGYLHTCGSYLSVNCNPSFLCQSVCLSSGTDSCFT